MKNNCFMDFDGTIICNKKRLYQFFIDNICNKYKEALTEDEFWALKKLGINEIEWINKQYKDNISVKEWNERKSEIIESKYYLNYNKLFDFSVETLKKLSYKYNLILITRRSNEKNVLDEIGSFNISSYFNKILVLPHNGGTKSDFIKNNGINILDGDILVGDTEDDIEAALQLGITPFLVTSGIRSNWIVNKLFNGKHVNVIENIKDLL